jgi:copper resistance protein D
MTASDLIVLALRAFSFGAALQAVGAFAFLSLFGTLLSASAESVRGLARATAGVAIVAVVAYQAAEPARLTGSFSGVLDGSLQAALLASAAGAATAVRTLGLAMIWMGMRGRYRAAQALGSSGAVLVIASFTLLGHTASHDRHWLLAALLMVHLSVAAFWFGALLPLRLVSMRETANGIRTILERFSRIAVRSVPTIFFAGLAMAWMLLPGLASLRTPYGLLLLAKVGGFTMLMVLAALNKWRWVPALAAGDGRAPGALRRSVSAEWVLIVTVITITAWMTGVYSPDA